MYIFVCLYVLEVSKPEKCLPETSRLLMWQVNFILAVDG